jgi:hypothetical protein
MLADMDVGNNTAKAVGLLAELNAHLCFLSLRFF